MNKISSLVGKYIFISEDGFHLYGKIVEEVSNGYFLVHMLSGEFDTFGYSLYNINQMIQDDNDDIMGWQFFKTKEDFNRYLKWRDAPIDEENKIVHLVKS